MIKAQLQKITECEKTLHRHIDVKLQKFLEKVRIRKGF